MQNLSKRQLQVGQQMMKIIAPLLQDEIYYNIWKANICVNDVIISRDMKNAKVFVAVVQQNQNEIQNATQNQIQKEIIYTLNHDKKIRKIISTGLSMKYIPKLSFYIDVSAIRYQKINKIINSNEFVKKSGNDN